MVRAWAATVNRAALGLRLTVLLKKRRPSSDLGVLTGSALLCGSASRVSLPLLSRARFLTAPALRLVLPVLVLPQVARHPRADFFQSLLSPVFLIFLLPHGSPPQDRPRSPRRSRNRRDAAPVAPPFYSKQPPPAKGQLSPVQPPAPAASTLGRRRSDPPPPAPRFLLQTGPCLLCTPARAERQRKDPNHPGQQHERPCRQLRQGCPQDSLRPSCKPLLPMLCSMPRFALYGEGDC